MKWLILSFLLRVAPLTFWKSRSAIIQWKCCLTETNRKSARDRETLQTLRELGGLSPAPEGGKLLSRLDAYKYHARTYTLSSTHEYKQTKIHVDVNTRFFILFHHILTDINLIWLETLTINPVHTQSLSKQHIAHICECVCVYCKRKKEQLQIMAPL